MLFAKKHYGNKLYYNWLLGGFLVSGVAKASIPHPAKWSILQTVRDAVTVQTSQTPFALMFDEQTKYPIVLHWGEGLEP